MSQILSLLHGIENELLPPQPTDNPYETGNKLLPSNILEAIDALKSSEILRKQMGDQFIDYILHIKNAEVARFFSEVTDWEHQEYFEIY